jgi:hypothetical protein
MKFPMSSQRKELFTSLLDQSAGPKLAVGVLEAEYKEKYKKLDGQPAYGNVMCI